MNKKTKYYYDKKSLSYKKISDSNLIISTILNILIPAFAIASIMTLFICFFVFSFIDSPREREAMRELHNLQLQFEAMQKDLQISFETLDHIEYLDNYSYRMVLGMEPIDESIRKAGFGGTNRYEQHKGYNYSDLIIETKKNIDQLNKRLFIQSKSFDEIINRAKNKSDMFASIPAIQPVSNKSLKRMASGYGWRIDPIYKIKKFHHGMDFAAPIGTPVYATGNGIIEKIKTSRSKKSYGNYILIDHGYDYQSFYAHLDKVLVSKGKKVKRGDLIGYVGNTGKSTAPHLHYEIRYKNQKINPVNFYHNDLSPIEYEEMLFIASQENQSFD